MNRFGEMQVSDGHIYVGSAQIPLAAAAVLIESADDAESVVTVAIPVGHSQQLLEAWKRVVHSGLRGPRADLGIVSTAPETGDIPRPIPPKLILVGEGIEGLPGGDPVAGYFGRSGIDILAISKLAPLAGYFGSPLAGSRTFAVTGPVAGYFGLEEFSRGNPIAGYFGHAILGAAPTPLNDSVFGYFGRLATDQESLFLSGPVAGYFGSIHGRAAGAPGNAGSAVTGGTISVSITGCNTVGTRRIIALNAVEYLNLEPSETNAEVVNAVFRLPSVSGGSRNVSIIDGGVSP